MHKTTELRRLQCGKIAKF